MLLLSIVYILLTYVIYIAVALIFFIIPILRGKFNLKKTIILIPILTTAHVAKVCLESRQVTPMGIFEAVGIWIAFYLINRLLKKKGYY
jgi:hypothetical protein